MHFERSVILIQNKSAILLMVIYSINRDISAVGYGLTGY